LIKNRLFSDITRTELFKLLLSQLILFVIGTYFVGYKFYVIYWLLPYLTAFQMITWFIELSEHYPMIQTAKNNLEASRNRFSHAIEHFFTGIHGENYHLIHHLFPAIPFWNLEKAHKILMKDFDYQEVNKDFGGIFFSKNNNAPMWKVLWSKYEAA
ncbi:fatty acid desaturase, partial [Neisseria meningitidis]